MKPSLVLPVFIIISCVYASDQWPHHDISTLKLLQIVHRHGDRTPTEFAPNDPFKNDANWPEGIGMLTTAGKYRMYKLGQFLRKEYHQYLGDGYSPREVYARSSITSRCIESVSCLLSGAYPPKNTEWQWDNDTDTDIGRIWQPFPIETFMPKVDDLVCNEDKFCPIVYLEQQKIMSAPQVVKFVADRRELFENLTKIAGRPIDSIESGRSLHGTLEIEANRGYFWSEVWTKSQELSIIDQLREVHRMSYMLSWNSTIIKRLRGGGLVREFVSNVQSAISNGFKAATKKLYVYSTHDTVVAAVMNALNMFNDEFPPFGATVLFELHLNGSQTTKSVDDYFVRLYYHNETLSGVPHAIPMVDCDNAYDCPLQRFLSNAKTVLYTDFDKECNASSI